METGARSRAVTAGGLPAGQEERPHLRTVRAIGGGGGAETLAAQVARSARPVPPLQEGRSVARALPGHGPIEEAMTRLPTGSGRC